MRVQNVVSPQGIYGVNKTTPASAIKAASSVQQNQKQDTVSISTYGKQQSTKKGGVSDALQALLEQKKGINESRTNLVNSTLEKGSTLETIQPQLKEFSEQLKVVDKQISEMMAKEQQEAINKVNGDKRPQISKPSSDQGSDISQSLTFLGNDVKVNKMFSSIRSKMAGEARVLARQIATDGQGASSTAKAEKLANLQQRMEKLTVTEGSSMGETNAKIMQNIVDGAKPKPSVDKPKTEDIAVKAQIASYTKNLQNYTTVPQKPIMEISA